MTTTELWLPTNIDLNKAPAKIAFKFKAALASGDVSVIVAKPDESGVRRVEMVVTTRLPLAKPKQQILVADYKTEKGKSFWRNMGARPDASVDAQVVFAAAIPFVFCLNETAEVGENFDLACVMGSKTYKVSGRRANSANDDLESFELIVPISKATKPQIIEVEIKNGVLESARVKLPVFGDGKLWRVS